MNEQTYNACVHECAQLLWAGYTMKEVLDPLPGRPVSRVYGFVDMYVFSEAVILAYAAQDISLYNPAWYAERTAAMVN